MLRAQEPSHLDLTGTLLASLQVHITVDLPHDSLCRSVCDGPWACGRDGGHLGGLWGHLLLGAPLQT